MLIDVDRKIFFKKKLKRLAKLQKLLSIFVCVEFIQFATCSMTNAEFS